MLIENMLLATAGEILRHAQHILLVQRAGVAQQGNPGLNVVVLGRGQIALGAIELLFGVEHIDVDALPAKTLCRVAVTCVVADFTASS